MRDLIRPVGRQLGFAPARLAVPTLLVENIGWPGGADEGRMRRQEPAKQGVKEVMRDHHNCSGKATVRLAAKLTCGQIWVAELNLEGGQAHVVMELSEGWKGTDAVEVKILVTKPPCVWLA